MEIYKFAPYFELMKIKFAFLLLAVALLTSCSDFNNVLKSTDYEYRYEAGKSYFAEGEYQKASTLLGDLVMVLKGTPNAQECLFMLGMCHYYSNDFETAAQYFNTYYKTYPKGDYTEMARFYSGKASYYESPDPRLDQTATYTAINQLQEFLEFYPYSERREEVNDMIFQLQDRLVQKEYEAAKLYYNLGSYVGNCFNGGSNYEACIITAENALKTYPYTNLREDLFIMILRSRYELAVHSVDEKSADRYRETIDEYFGFKNEFPESKYMKEAEKIYADCSSKVKD